MTTWLRGWIFVAMLALAWGAGGVFLGYQWAQAQHLQEQARVERAAREQLQAANARGDALTRGLVAQLAQVDFLKQETHRALSQATSGRACFDSGALRVLDAAPGIDFVPAPASGAVAADAAVATDTDIASWVVDAAAQYETCRARLDALIGWHMQGAQ
jgi:hypothetical protein